MVVLFFKALSKNYTFPWMHIQLARAEWTAYIGGLFGSIFFFMFHMKEGKDHVCTGVTKENPRPLANDTRSVLSG